MKLTEKDDYIIVEDDKNNVKGFSNFLQTNAYNRIKDENVVVNILKYGKLSLEELLTFLELSNTQRKRRKSFVIVNDTINIDSIPDELMVVPTLQEAHDIIQMENLERDLDIF